jgi:hypothetical protein
MFDKNSQKRVRQEQLKEDIVTNLILYKRAKQSGDKALAKVHLDFCIKCTDTLEEL